MSAKTVFEAWVRLNTRSTQWHGLLADAGLSLPTSNEADFLAALARTICVDRGVPGFEDFDQGGNQGIYPGDPARSLLYHALASSNVLSYRKEPLKDFPSFDEITDLENLVYSSANPSLEQLVAKAIALSEDENPEFGVVVFAYEYQCASRTVHRKHADLCFSRTGIARVGTHAPFYSPAARGWLTFDENDPAYTIRAIPARYAAFFAVRLSGDPESFGPKYFLEPDVEEPGDNNRRFWVPLHKLFSGPDCIRDCPNLTVTFSAKHVNEKLRRMHLELARRGMAAHAGNELDHYPFRFSTHIADLQVRSETATVVPCVQSLVKPAELDGTFVTFRVPPDPALLLSTFRIRPDDNLHYPCPKWVNCRTKVVDEKPTDLNEDPNLVALVHQGGYDALHYVDFTGDGYIEVEIDGCKGLDHTSKISAYSIVAQPDFLPFVSQSDLFDWWRELCPEELKKYAWADGPDPTPLSQSRLSANFATHPGVFEKADDTVTSVVGMPRHRVGLVHKIDPSFDGSIANSCLPDDGSGDFAPGWDIAISKTDRLEHLSAYGLSSPFPEDARLCAGFGATWPAAAPDITSWFPSDGYPVVVPLGNQASGWDQTLLPVTPFLSGTFAEYPNAAYSDWVQTTLNGKLDLVRLRNVTLKMYTTHLLVMARLFKVIGAETDDDRARYSIVYFSQRRKEDPLVNLAMRAAHATKFTADQAFEIHYFEESDRSVDTHDFKRLTLKTTKTVKLYAHPDSVLLEDDQGNWVEKE